MGNEKRGITIAGTLIADVFYEIDTYPEQGRLTNIRSTEKNVGGTGNMILDFAKMDAALPLNVCAVIGTDENADMLVERLSHYPNINLDAVTRRGISAVTLVMNARDSKQRTFFFLPESCDEFDENDIDWELTDAKIFHLEYLLSMKKVDAPDEKFGTHGAKILHDAKQRGMLTSIDIVSEQSDRARTVVKAALAYTDICTINEVEAEGATGITLTENGGINPEKAKEALRCLKALGVQKWAVIHAPSGGYGYDCEKDQMFYVPSLSLPEGYIKGTNGAGDAYCSGILYGVYYDWDLETSMRFATACAACSLSEVNGTDGLRPEKEIWELERSLIG